MDGNLRTGQQGFGAENKGASRLGGIDLHDNGTRRRRAKLQDFILLRRDNTMVRHVVYFFVPHPSR